MSVTQSVNFPDRTPFIGRQRERALLLGELEGGARLITLTGPSGMGKTRLAQVAMRDAASTFEDRGGLWFCNMGSSQTQADLEATVARTLGISDARGQNLEAALHRRGPTLLLLDNMDRVVDVAAEVLGHWLDRCSELRILITSIVPIGMVGETRFEVGPLESDDAVGLYLERANRAGADRTFSDAEKTVVEELVGRLDRIPLAIELAAARIRVLPPRTLLSRIGERFTLLQSEEPGRHGSLLQALSLTWEFLSDREQLILARASTFHGGFTLEAAEAILVEEKSPSELLTIMDGLRSKALLQIDESEPPRFSLLECVREFAAEELKRLGGEEDHAIRHSDFFVRNGERFAALISGPQAPEAIRWLKAERENLITVLRRCATIDPASAARAGLALAPVLAMEGPTNSELELLDMALEAARVSNDPLCLVRALRARTRALDRQGRKDEALVDVNEGLELARASGLRVEEGYVLLESASIRSRMSLLEREAHSHLEIAIRIGREENESLLVAFALHLLALIDRSPSPLQQAKRLSMECVEILRRNGHLLWLGASLQNLAYVLSSQGRFRQSRQLMDEALEVYHRLGNRIGEYRVLVYRGELELMAGLLAEAEHFVEKAFELRREISFPRYEAEGLAILGTIALERGDIELAERRLSEALTLLEHEEEPRLTSSILPVLAAAEAKLGRIQEAERTMADAYANLGEVEDRASRAAIVAFEGIIELEKARSAAAKADRARAALLEASARKRLADSSVQSDEAEHPFVAVRLLQQALAASNPVAAKPEGPGLLVGPSAEWFELGDSGRIDLRRRGPCRPILAALVDQRISHPGIGLTREEIFESGWGDEFAAPDSAATRVYNNIRMLRSLGLSTALLRHADGYLLDPKLPVIRVNSDI